MKGVLLDLGVEHVDALLGAVGLLEDDSVIFRSPSFGEVATLVVEGLVPAEEGVAVPSDRLEVTSERDARGRSLVAEEVVPVGARRRDGRAGVGSGGQGSGVTGGRRLGIGPGRALLTLGAAAPFCRAVMLHKHMASRIGASTLALANCTTIS